MLTKRLAWAEVRGEARGQSSAPAYLHRLKHVGQPELHAPTALGVVDGRHHGQVEGDDGVGERPHGHLGLEVPELAAVVTDRPVVVPDQANLLLVFSVRQREMRRANLTAASLPEGVGTSLLQYWLHVVLDKVLRIQHIEKIKLGVGWNGGFFPSLKCSGSFLDNQLLKNFVDQAVKIPGIKS